MESSKYISYRGKGERSNIKCAHAQFKETVQPEWKDNLCIKQIKTLKETFKKIKRKVVHVLI